MRVLLRVCELLYVRAVAARNARYDRRGPRTVLPIPVISVFHDMVKPFFERMLLSDRESLSLSDARDTLLPKLLSGQIRVKDAEKLAETTE